MTIHILLKKTYIIVIEKYGVTNTVFGLLKNIKPIMKKALIWYISKLSGGIRNKTLGHFPVMDHRKLNLIMLHLTLILNGISLNKCIWTNHIEN